MFHTSASRGAHASGSPDIPVALSSDRTHAGKGAINHVQVAIVGTGFSGLGMAIQLKKHGYNDFLVIEQAADIGGTWRDNTYPGCACDIPSHLYSFSFALNPNWSRVYPQQREIQNYLRRCTRRFRILPHIRWNSTLEDAVWNEDEQCWHLTTTQEQFKADILICGNGPLSVPSIPNIPGIEQFEGALFHSARWRHDYDLTGKRVAVIGTGASAIQFIPHIQPQVGHLTLFQRTPPWITPRGDHPIPRRQQMLFRIFPLAQRLLRTRIYLLNELTGLGLIYRPKIMEMATRMAQHHLARQVQDPALREILTPHYAMGCKRILVSDDFYPAIAQPNVEVVTQHIRSIQAHSIVTADGREHEVDAIICGTGFHVTDAPFPQHIRGRNQQTLAASWQTSPSAYLGTTIAGFPNLFLLIGPNTGLGHNSMVYMIESQLTYILDCLHKMKRQKLRSVEVLPTVQENFNGEMQRRMQSTVWNSGCASWYLDATGHNAALWPGLTFEFRRRTRHFDREHYASVSLSEHANRLPIQR